jgi:hypothetical protein
VIYTWFCIRRLRITQITVGVSDAWHFLPPPASPESLYLQPRAEYNDLITRPQPPCTRQEIIFAIFPRALAHKRLPCAINLAGGAHVLCRGGSALFSFSPFSPHVLYIHARTHICSVMKFAGAELKTNQSQFGRRTCRRRAAARSGWRRC